MPGIENRVGGDENGEVVGPDGIVEIDGRGRDLETRIPFTGVGLDPWADDEAVGPELCEFGFV